MKVKELIEYLNELDGELEIFCYSEDENILPKNHLIRLLDITSVSIVEAEKKRGEDRIPSFKIGRSPISEKHAILDVTTKF